MVTASVGRLKNGKTTAVYQRALRRRKRVLYDGKVSTSGFQPAPGRTLYGGVIGVPLDEWPGSLANAWATSPEIVIQPPRMPSRAESWQWFTDQLATHLQQHPEDEWALIVDEYNGVRRTWPMEDFNYLITSVPRPDVDIYLTAHKPMQVHADTRSNIDRWLIFQTTDPADLDVLRRRGIPAADLAQLPALPFYEFYEWDESRGRGAFVRNSAAWHVALTPAPVPVERANLFRLVAHG